MSERFPTQESLIEERDVLEGYTPEQLVEYLVSKSEEIARLQRLRKLATEVLDATVGYNPVEGELAHEQ